MIEIIIGESGSGKTTYINNELINYAKQDVAYLPQEISGIFNPLKTIYSQLFEINFNKNKFDNLLNTLSLNNLDLYRYPYEYSVGELQRFGILIVLLKEGVKKIFLDEPTSNLDLENRIVLVNILKDIKTSMVISTHDLDFANKLNGNIKIIENGKLKPFDKKYINKNDFSIILEKNHRKIITNDKEFNFLVGKKTTLIFGKSGYGKTSILHKINKTFIKNGIKTALLNQNYSFSLSPQRTILQTLFEAINFRDKKFFNSKKDVIEIIKIFRELNLSSNLLKRYPYELSEGEKQRILIIRVILLKYSTFLLDEPTSSQNIENEKSMLNFLQTLQQKYTINLVIVSHSQYIINSLLTRSDYILYFKDQFKYEIYQNNILK